MVRFSVMKIQVYSNLGSPYIDGRRCSFETKKIRKNILEMMEVNEEFALPKKYTYVITELNGFAKIIKAPNLGQKLPTHGVVVPKGTLCNNCNELAEDIQDGLCYNCWGDEHGM